MITDIKPVSIPLNSPAQGRAARLGRFVRHFLELQIPMALGAIMCYLLVNLIPASSSFAIVYHPGTYLFSAGDVFFLTVPVVAWMIFRGCGWSHSLTMAGAMVAPVAAISIIGELAGYDYLLWLLTAGYPAMSLGMLAHMLYQEGTAGHDAKGQMFAEVPRAEQAGSPGEARSVQDLVVPITGMTCASCVGPREPSKMMKC